jgi:hypothetical protein
MRSKILQMRTTAGSGPRAPAQFVFYASGAGPLLRIVRQRTAMTPGDMLGIGLFGGFGVWWLAAPRSVAAFYTRLTHGKTKMPRPIAIRLMGAPWFVLVVTVVIVARKQ